MTLKRVKAEPDLLLSAPADLDEHEELFEAIDENEFENTEKFDQVKWMLKRRKMNKKRPGMARLKIAFSCQVIFHFCNT